MTTLYSVSFFYEQQSALITSSSPSVASSSSSSALSPRPTTPSLSPTPYQQGRDTLLLQSIQKVLDQRYGDVSDEDLPQKVSGIIDLVVSIADGFLLPEAWKKKLAKIQDKVTPDVIRKDSILYKLGNMISVLSTFPKLASIFEKQIKFIPIQNQKQ